MAEDEPKRSRPWGVVIGALVIFALGSWVLYDLKPWVKNVPAPRPTSTIRILGRDDEATKKAEAELDGPAPARRPSPSASAVPPSGSAAPATSR